MKLLNKRLFSFLLAVVMLLGMMPMTVFATEAEHTHTYENGICTGCGTTVSPYLQQLPEDIIGCTNLYDSLVPVKGYYTATKYDTGNGDVLSVVIPVEPGDRIAASSFGSVSENMGSVNGIRVTYLLGDEIVTSLSPSEVCNGYISDGYITVPDGVDAVCVPWWKPSNSNWLTLSQISKDFTVHSPKTVSAQAPTCAESGYTAGEICEVCNASLGEREEIPPTGHTYSGDSCTVCGAVNLEAILGGKYVSILGDSISTFNGYSNDATVNTTIGGNGPRYDAGTADTKPGSYCLLESVDQTWWMHFANRSGMKLLVNNSWAGSQVFGGQTSDGRVIPAAYLDRCVNLHDNTPENNPGNAPINPDVIFVYLGINDYNFNRSNVGTGTVDYAGLVSSDGTYATPATFGEAYGIMLHKMCNTYPDAQIFAMTLLPENLYSVDKTIWEQHNAYIRAAAEYYDIPVVDLAEKCAITWDNYSGYMIDKIHPTTAGMQLISDCIETELLSYYKENLPHIHIYESTTTAPTCTEQGYTTYTCTCGDNYVDDYMDAAGHSYENGICIWCADWNICWEVGTIAAANGANNANATRIRTLDYLRLSDFAGVCVNNGYQLTWLAYDAGKKYIGNGTSSFTGYWQPSGHSIATADIQDLYVDAVYFRLALKNVSGGNMTLEDADRSGVTFVPFGQALPEPEFELGYENSMNIGSWQDGAIWNGKLFVLGAAGTGALYDLENLSRLATFSLDSADVLEPHANSVCFGSTYYSPDDQYPLLYVNVYNNYASAKDRMEGTCCVYRISNTDSGFTTELVQVIRIGFVEDLSLWKSKENNGDVRPYGNFLVDTDDNKLYAYVMRDAAKATRFFKFDLPKLTDGIYSETYGCNVVTLESTDIEGQFDTEYFNYLQGGTYSSGMILSAEGFNSGGSAEPALRIVDLQTGTVSATYYMANSGLTTEPEVVCIDPATGLLYYAPADGIVRILSIPDVHFHGYTACVTAPTCTGQGYTTYTCTCGDSYVDDYVYAAGHSWSDGVCAVCGEVKEPYQRLTYFTVQVEADSKTYTDNAVLYLPANYSPDGEPVKLVIFCKQGSSQITSSSNPIESVGFYNYLISLGYAVLGVDGVPDVWRDELGLDNTRVVGNPMAVQGTEKAYDYVIENYNIANDGCFISGYSQGGHYAQNVIDMTDIPILAAAEQSPVCSMQYHQWDLNASVTVNNVKYSKAARLNVARIYGFPEFATNAELLKLAYDSTLVEEYDPWVRNSQNVYTGFVQKSNLWYLPEGTSVDDITMTHATKCPVKIWCAEDDTAISADVMKVFVKAIQNAGGTAEISIASSGGHGFFQKQTAVGTFTENGKTYNTLPIAVEIADWFAQYGGYEHKHIYENGICTGCGEKLSFEGKTISILGDSISTYTGVSNDTSANATLKGGAIYYNPGTQGIYRADTWWQQTIDALGMELLVNNSWSGSTVLHTRSGTAGAYVDRCVQLHNTAGDEPDVIVVFLGTNDFSYYQSTLGTANIDYAKLITDNGDGTYTYATPKTTCEAYAVMLHKMVNRYPDAEVYCMNLLPRRDPDHDGKDVVPAPTQFNGELAKVISYSGCTVVDLENCDITPAPEDFDIYITDQRVHPGPLGMDKMTQALIDTMMGKEDATFAVSQNLVNVTANASGGIVLAGGSFNVALTPAAGFDKLTVTVTMGGKDVTASVYSDGKVNIPAVTGNVVITASAAVDGTPHNYYWEISGDNFVNVVKNDLSVNALTKKAGSITDGVIKSAYFHLEKPVVLRHNLPWIVEWRVSGTNWTGMLLSGNVNSSATGNNYLFKTTQNTGFIGFGESVSGSYHNYGIALASQGVDLAAEHTYRAENRIAADGSNMVYLLVDGKDYGPMNHYYIGGNNNQGKQVGWLNGRDFCFFYLGSNGHPLNNCKLDYLSVTECDHTYANGICTGCGEAQPGPVITQQPVNGEAKLGERYMVEVKAEGEGLKYQWYFRNAGSSKWNKSSVKDNTYDDVMTTARAGREVYCVIIDANGNSVTTDIVKLICLPSVALEIVTQPVNDEAVLGEDFCVTVEAKGDGLKYQWYFRNAGSDRWYKSSVKDNTYDDVMTKARAGREIYCVITDAYGNSVTTETVKLICIPTELEIISQPTSAEVYFGEMFCATVEAKGDGLKYQWYFRNSGTDKWYKSGVRDNTYDDVMTRARNHREIYCVITDMWGNSVTTDTVKLTAVPSVELKVLSQSYESAVMGERYCVTVEAQGDGLNYQWYFRNAGASRWSKSGVRDNTYDDVMNKTRANREVYCVISDACGNQITTEVITLTVEK